MQMTDGVLKVCMYASRSTNNSEQKYAAYELECLAAVWAVELFRHYVQAKPFTLKTDCYSIQWLQTRQVGSRVLRWALRLQEFDYVVVHRPGKLNPLCDGMSRDPLPSTETYGEEPIESLYAVHTRASKGAPAKHKRQEPSDAQAAPLANLSEPRITQFQSTTRAAKKKGRQGATVARQESD